MQVRKLLAGLLLAAMLLVSSTMVWIASPVESASASTIETSGAIASGDSETVPVYTNRSYLLEITNSSEHDVVAEYVLKTASNVPKQALVGVGGKYTNTALLTQGNTQLVLSNKSANSEATLGYHIKLNQVL